MNPWLILAALLALAGGGAGCYSWGAKNATNACKAEKLEVERKAHANYVEGVKRAIEQADQIDEQNAEAESASVQRRARIETVFQTIDREVIRYVQTDAGRGLCFDAAGLRLYNAANRGELTSEDQAAPGAGGPGAVSGPAAGAGRLSGGGVADQQNSGAALPPVPGSAAGPSGLDQAQQR